LVVAISIGGVVYRQKGGVFPNMTRAMWLGAIAYVLTNLSFMLATKMTTAANAIVLQFTAPVWTILISYFFLADKPRWIDWVTVGIILPSIGLFFADSLSMSGLWGNVIALGSGVFMAAMAILLREEHEHSMEMIVVGSLMAVVIGLPSTPVQTFDWTNIALILGLGVFQLGFGLMLYTWALRHLTAVKALIIMTLEPILNPVWVALFAGELPGFWAMIGGSIVIVVIGVRIWLTMTEEEAEVLPEVGI